MELLQNAHDAMVDGGVRGTVEFVVTDGALLVANQGVPFDEQRIGALVRLGASEKEVQDGRRHTIGYKGVGFTSVFEISDTPQCVSRDVAFAFDESRARDLVRGALKVKPRAVPIRSFPFEMEMEELGEDELKVRALLLGGAITVIRLPFKKGLTAAKVSTSLTSALTPQALLFMPSIQRLRIDSTSGLVTWSRRTGAMVGKGRLMRIESSNADVFEWLTLARQFRVDDGPIEALGDPLWKGITTLNVAVALPWKKGPSPDAAAMPVHVYYPTDDRLDRSVLVHGDFYVKSDRRRIETENAGGRISDLVASEAAEAVAALAESIADRGNSLLRTLAPKGRPDGFGHRVSGLIDEALSRHRIVRSATGARRTPEEVMFLAVDPETRPADRRAMARMLGRKPDVVAVGDERDVEDFLESLGSRALSVQEVADRLTPSRGSEHENDLGVLGRWVGGVDPYRQIALQRLRTKQLLRDMGGTWRRPSELALRVGDVPPLPRCVARTELRPLKSRAANDFVKLLQVEELDAKRALTLVLNAAAGSRKDDDWKEIHDFVHRLWKRDKKLVESMRAGLGAVRVPASGPRAPLEWRRADEVYFSAAWLGVDNLERLYGQFDEADFLAAPVPARGKVQLQQFYRLLGITDKPRVETSEGEWVSWGLWVSGLNATSQWKRSFGPDDGRACLDHPNSQRVQITCLDRLDEVLDNPSRKTSVALAHVLASEAQPFGTPDQTYCIAQSHRSTTPTRRLPGYQAWLLRSRSWLPVRGIDGALSLARPAGAWIVEGRSKHVLPRVQLPLDVARALKLPSSDAPTVGALEQLLRLLERAHPDLAKAPDGVRQTAQWAQGRLNSLVRQSSSRPKSFAFVVEVGGKLGWEKEPLANDLPGGLMIPGTSVLPRPNDSITRVYSLDRASELVSIKPLPGPRRKVRGLFSSGLKEMIVAVTTARGLDAHRAAVRLAVMEQRSVDGLALEIKVRRTSSRIESAAYLEVRRDKRAAVRDSVLYRDVNKEPNLLSLSEQLAAYLDIPTMSETLALLLGKPADVLSLEGIGDLELADAARMLQSVKRRVPDEPEEEVDDELVEEPESVVELEKREERPPPLPRPKPGTREPSGEPREPPKLLDGKVEIGKPRPGPRRPPRDRDEGRPPPAEGGNGKAPGRRWPPDDEVEAKAMEIAIQYGTDLRAGVKDVHEDKLGWDLEFTFPDGQWRPVEVKGTSGDGPFIITRRERSAARQNYDYELVWVANLADPARACVRIFRTFGVKLDEASLDAMSWTVDDWSAIPYEERAVREVSKK
jgi:hypothetical protein